MILIDTSIWIEFLKTNDPIYTILKNKLESGEVLAIECVFGELLQGVKNKREEKLILEYWYNLPHFSIDGNILNAGIKSNKDNWLNKGIGLIDATILIYARQYNCKIWTLDKKLLSIMDKSETFST